MAVRPELSGDRVNPSGDDTRNPATLRSRERQFDGSIGHISAWQGWAETGDEDAGRGGGDAAASRLGLGWGTRRIAAEIGCNRETVQRFLAAGAWAPCRVPTRPSLLAGHAAWLDDRLRRHRGNADVVRQELASELSIVVSLRTVERAVSHLRRELAAEALATVRFETPPGRQLQIDFGQRRIAIEGERNKVFLFVATLGYSRRVYAAAFRHERQSAWLEGIEGAFFHFGGLPGELLLDNARALVKHHDAVTREVEFTDRLHAFARYWDVRPVACAPYRARTKGKDERGVGYVKHNAIAGRSFASWGALEAHLAWWMTVMLDVFLRSVVGFHLSFDAASDCRGNGKLAVTAATRAFAMLNPPRDRGASPVWTERPARSPRRHSPRKAHRFLRFVAARRRRAVSDLTIEHLTADEVLAFLRQRGGTESQYRNSKLPAGRAPQLLPLRRRAGAAGARPMCRDFAHPYHEGDDT